MSYYIKKEFSKLDLALAKYTNKEPSEVSQTKKYFIERLQANNLYKADKEIILKILLDT